MNLVLLVLLAAPHVVMGIAWVLWICFPQRLQEPRWINGLLFSGLLACSLNLAVFWVYVMWLSFHQTDMSWWKGRGKFELVCNFLIGSTLLAAIVGIVRGRVALVFAEVTGYLIWVVGHVGIL